MISSVSYAFDAYRQPKLNTSIQDAISTLSDNCQTFTLDTGYDHALEISDHHQSFVIGHRWSDGSALAFMSHSETSHDDEGQILGFTLRPEHFGTTSQDLVASDSTMALKHKIFISEQHPSGIAWLPAPTKTARDQGYLIIASENENKVRVQKFSNDHFLGEVAVLEQSHLTQITDIWLAQEGDESWLILHNMNAGTGAAYKAATQDLFQYGTNQEGQLAMSAFQFVNRYTSPSDTGCGKSIGQNAQLVKDNTNQWFVVHTYTGDRVCGANIGSNFVKAYRAFFSNEGHFRIAQNAAPYAQATVGVSNPLYSLGADGAAGFKVSNDGRLVVYLGGQYANPSFFDWRTAVQECSSTKR